jgi:AraC-like DNA-binding protein
MLRYEERAPAPSLAPWIACYWSIRATHAAPTPHRVLPDGCADVILDIAAATRPVAVGAMRVAIVVPLAGTVDRSEEIVVAHAVARIDQTHGRATVRSLAKEIGTGERRLERLFDQCVGLSPKALARVARFGNAVHAAACDAPWTRIASDAGYTDQSHLIREFRALAGVTPSEYRAERVGFVQSYAADDS